MFNWDGHKLEYAWWIEWAIHTELYRTVHSSRDSVRLVPENSERGGDPARKCSGTVRGCTPSLAYILGEPYRTIPHIPPSIRFGSRSKIPSGELIQLENARYGSVRLEDVRHGEPSLMVSGFSSLA